MHYHQPYLKCGFQIYVCIKAAEHGPNQDGANEIRADDSNVEFQLVIGLQVFWPLPGK